MNENLQETIVEIIPGKAQKIIEKRLKAKENPTLILDDVRNGIQKAVVRYELGDYGRTELQMIHIIIDECMVFLTPHLKKHNSELGKILTGTLPTDRDEMGRDITPLILFGAGFDVYDLGSQITSQKFVKKAEEDHPDIVAISGLDNESLEEALKTVSRIAQIKPTPKIIVGPLVKCGLQMVIDNETVRTLKADGGWNDAIESVQLSKSLLKRQVSVIEP